MLNTEAFRRVAVAPPHPSIEIALAPETNRSAFIASLARILYFEALPLPPASEWYGIGNVLRDLLGLPPGFPLNVNLHHGPCLTEKTIDFYDADDRPVLVCRRSFLPIAGRRPGKIALNCGTMQVHYRRRAGVVPRPDRRGTLAFPRHSTHHVRSVFDADAYAEQLLGLPPRFQPVVVCLYWKDILHNQAKPFLDRGLPVVTAGHMADPTFVERLYALMSRFRYVTGNDVGSHATFALEMGIPYFHLGDLPFVRDETGGDPLWAGKGRQHPDRLISIEDMGPVVGRYRELVPGPDAVEPINPVLASFVQNLHGCDEPIDFDALRECVVRAAVGIAGRGNDLHRDARDHA